MTAFNPSTAYKNDWQWMDFVEAVTWERNTEAGPARVSGLKGRWGDFDTPESQSLAAGMAFTNEAAAVVVWQPDSADGTTPVQAFAPVEGQILRRDNKGNEGWLIQRATRSRFGHWLCACEKEVTNG